MSKNKTWTQKELDYIEENWGKKSIKTIAKTLGRSINGVKIKARKVGLGNAIYSLDGVTISQLAQALNVSYSWTLKDIWIKKYDFPVKYKITCKERRYAYICLDDFWKWAEEHKHLINFAKLEKNILGIEPAWVNEKRSADYDNLTYKSTNKEWTPTEDRMLINMVKSYKYTYPELASALHRTEPAIKRRLYELNIKARPVRMADHDKWTVEQITMLINMVLKGYGENTIADKIGKSSLAVRGKLERMEYDFKNNKFNDDNILERAQEYACIGVINDYIKTDGYTTIVISKAKYSASIFIDTEDVEKVSKYTWYLFKPKNGEFKITCSEGEQNIFLKDVIMDFKGDKRLMVLNINKNIYDCRKENLKIVSCHINKLLHNSSNSNNTSGKTGVIYNESKKLWCAQMRINSELKTKSFSISKYGADKAKELAITQREEWEKEVLKKQGAVV
jgi:hypothetical protein